MSKLTAPITQPNLTPVDNRARSIGQGVTAEDRVVTVGSPLPEDSVDASPAGICQYTKSDGSRCHAYAVHGSRFCFAHDPKSAVERQAARVKGGQERSRKSKVLAGDTPNAALTTSTEIESLLADTINQVRRGEIDPHVSNAVGYLASVLMKAKEQGETERRLARVESILKSQWANPLNSNSEFEFTNPIQGD